jgi:hypothetical protein
MTIDSEPITYIYYLLAINNQLQYLNQLPTIANQTVNFAYLKRSKLKINSEI